MKADNYVLCPATQIFPQYHVSYGESQKYDNFYIHDLQISNNKSVHLGIK